MFSGDLGDALVNVSINVFLFLHGGVRVYTSEVCLSHFKGTSLYRFQRSALGGN